MCSVLQLFVTYVNDGNKVTLIDQFLIKIENLNLKCLSPLRWDGPCFVDIILKDFVLKNVGINQYFVSHFQVKQKVFGGK